MLHQKSDLIIHIYTHDQLYQFCTGLYCPLLKNKPDSGKYTIYIIMCVHLREFNGPGFCLSKLCYNRGVIEVHV